MGQLNSLWIRDVLVEQVFGRIVIRTSASNCPYETSGNTGATTTTLAYFRNLWNNNPGQYGTSHNLATLLLGAGGGGGWAYVGTVSEANKYSLADGGNKDSWRGFAKHEIGHTWGLSHGHGARELDINGAEVGIMWGGNHASASSDEAATMIAERNSSNLNDIGSYPSNKIIRLYGFKDFATVSSPNHVIRVLDNDYDANADALTIDPNVQLTGTIGATINLSADRKTVLYTAPSGFVGNDSFHYRNLDGTTSNWGIVYVTVVGGSGGNQYKFDFGTGSSPLQTGYVRVHPSTNNSTTSWTAPSTLDSRDRGSGLSNLRRDIVYSNGQATFNVTLKNGSWRAKITVGDTYYHDRMRFRAEGVDIASNVTTQINQFREFTKTIDVNDGNINLEISDNGGSDANWVINGLELEYLGASFSSRKAALDDGSLTVYPTAREQINLRFKEAHRSEAIGILLTSVTGKVVKQQNIKSLTSNEMPINTSNLLKGLYFLKIDIAGSTIVKKVIIE